jgi:hypothetical protein
MASSSWIRGDCGESLFRATDPSKLGLLVPDTDKTVALSTSQAVAWSVFAMNY